MNTKELNIGFEVNGSVSQTIKILNNKTKKEFFHKLRTNKYFTFINGKDILEGSTLEKVGEIVHQETNDDTTFSDFVHCGLD